jgi:hypothetical protein
LGAIRIQQAKKGVRTQRKIVKIGKIFMFDYLKPWQS